jgi:transposase
MKPSQKSAVEIEMEEMIKEASDIVEGSYLTTEDARKIITLMAKALAKVEELRKGRDKLKARECIENWFEKIKTLPFGNFFNIAANSIKNHLETILNFFYNRSTNANAESFNSKIKLFRANLRGVTDVKFFLFRLEKLFA